MATRGKHYTPLDKKIFLEILKEFKDIVENKKSDGATLKEKETAWTAITTRFNGVLQISEKKTLAQLKKLWTNLKQTQREVLTKERQSRMATGGGPEEAVAEIDPDVAAIAPHLMVNAPSMFSSNKSRAEAEAAHDTDIPSVEEEEDDESPLRYEDIEYLIDDNDHESLADTTPSTSSATPVPLRKKICVESKIKKSESSGAGSSTSADIRPWQTPARETVTGVTRIELEIANIKKQHELKMCKLKECQLNIIHRFQTEHLLELQALEIRKAKAEAELAELKLRVAMDKE